MGAQTSPKSTRSRSGGDDRRLLAAPTSQLHPYQYTRLTGASGEFYVAAELTRRLWAASVTPQGVERTDVLAQHLETRKVLAIQVKTSHSDHFHMSKKLEEPTDTEYEWIILVSLRSDGERPEFYVVPRNVIAALMWVGRYRWLAAPSRSGRPHKDARPVVVADRVKQYHERWSWLHKPTSEIPYCLPDWFYGPDGVDKYGLPPGHPESPSSVRGNRAIERVMISTVESS